MQLIGKAYSTRASGRRRAMERKDRRQDGVQREVEDVEERGEIIAIYWRLPLEIKLTVAPEA